MVPNHVDEPIPTVSTPDGRSRALALEDSCRLPLPLLQDLDSLSDLRLGFLQLDDLFTEIDKLT
jgi:hypothetical protein